MTPAALDRPPTDTANVSIGMLEQQPAGRLGGR